MKVAPLEAASISHLLKKLNLNSRAVWKVVNVSEQSHLEASLVFKNFGTTWNFLNDVKDYAHAIRHHPTITTTYNKVNLKITTHDAGNKITAHDFELAEKVNSSTFLSMLKQAKAPPP